MRFILLKAFCFLLVFSSCKSNREVSRSFYYWKPSFDIAGEDARLLSALGNQRIYLKCFHVVWDKPTKSLKNTDVVSFPSKLTSTEMEFVPVVHLSNDIFLNMPFKGLEALSAQIIQSVDAISDSASFSWAELQIDCEWSSETREHYFSLLNLLKASLKPIDQKLSCSIMLKHIKSPDVAGVPPVDRGMLIFYNTGNIDEPGTRNSIYDADVAARYVSYIKNYRLPLDLALPVFSWGVHQRNGDVMSVIQNITLKETRESNLFYEKAKGLFVPLAECYFHGSYFKDTDRLRVEEISPRKSMRAAKQVKPFLNTQSINVALFHLDSNNTVRYGQEAFNELYSVFE
ncbi:MAG: hypothetical protein WED33_07320 [Bacteroidia bacterium]